MRLILLLEKNDEQTSFGHLPLPQKKKYFDAWPPSPGFLEKDEDEGTPTTNHKL